MGRISKIVGIFAAGQRRTGSRFDRNNAALAAAAELQPEEWEGDASKIGAAARAADHDVRIVARHLQLLDRFLPDDGLVQHDVVQHRTEGIFYGRAFGGDLDGL